MSFDSVELAIARSRIEAYAHSADEVHDEIIRESRQAQDCLDCEEFLSRGITAFEWLERCEETLVTATSEGLYDLTPEVEQTIESLHFAWLRPCQFAEEWVAKCQANGFAIDNLAAFRNCCERARNWIERNETYKLSKAAREQRFSEEPW